MSETNQTPFGQMTLPRHPQRKLASYSDAVDASKEFYKAAGVELDHASARLGRRITAENYDSPEVQKILKENAALSKAMGDKRALSRRMQRSSSMQKSATLSPSSPVGGDIYNAIPRFYDPLEYWDLSGVPWNVADEGHRHKLHKWLRLYYATHYLVPILIDIFTRFPLVGMKLEHEDHALRDVYEGIFLDSLKYEDFLVSLGRETWLVGEAFPLGSFDEDLGIWEHEELINPEDVVIDNFPLLDTRQIKIVPPDYLRRIAQTKSPAREWYMLQENYADIIPYLLKGEHIPISPVMIRQIANKLNDWDDHGTPILLRGLRNLLQEERLWASLEATAERAYSPFLLAKLGIMDMGDGLPPWLPTPEELESVRDDLDMALASDFRLMVYHFGLELQSVFGREQMPRLGDDFDRIERHLMMIFGINPSLLSAGANSQPYASSALQAEFMNQMLRTFQKQLKEHYHERAMVVAEAQKHIAYEKRGQTRIPLYERVVSFDEEGNKIVREVPKYTCPSIEFSTFDLRDEATERQFLQTLRGMGVPIPDEKLMIGIDWDIKSMVEDYNNELKEKTIAQQQAKMDTYTALTIKGLPVPIDLKAEVESVLMGGQGQQGQAPGGASAFGSPPGGEPGKPGAAGPGAPPGSPIVMPNPPAGLGPGPESAPPGGGAPPRAPNEGGPPGTVPEVSNERRPGLRYNTHRSLPKEGSNLSDFMEENPTLGVPFLDYVADYNPSDRDYGEIDNLDRSEIEDLHDRWPEYTSEYAARVATEVAERLSSARTEEKEKSAIMEPEELNLKENQELTKNAKGEEIILETPRKKRLEIEMAPEKKYSIVDPLAPDFEESDESESTEPESS